jgi:hypothetical protein
MCLFQTAYNQRDPVHSFLRQLMALPFLPAEHITDTFLRLETRNSNHAVQHVLDYIYRTRIRSPVFPVQFWLVYKTSCL